MKVVVDGRYTYDTNGIKVKTGDVVILPSPYWLRDVKGDTWEGTVTSLKSEYAGVCSSILAVRSKKKA